MEKENNVVSLLDRLSMAQNANERYGILATVSGSKLLMLCESLDLPKKSKKENRRAIVEAYSKTYSDDIVPFDKVGEEI